MLSEQLSPELERIISSNVALCQFAADMAHAPIEEIYIKTDDGIIYAPTWEFEDNTVHLIIRIEAVRGAMSFVGPFDLYLRGDLRWQFKGTTVNLLPGESLLYDFSITMRLLLP